MKTIFTILIMILSLGAMGQAAGTAVIKLKKNQVMEASSVKSFVFVPKGCKITSFLLTVRHGSNFKDFKCKGETLGKDVIAALKKVNPGESFFIENIKASCKNLKKKYEVAVK